MQQKRDIAAFAGSTLLFALALSAIASSLPKVNYNPSDALIVIGVASAILSARGAPWRRRLLFAGSLLAVFSAVDYAFLASGLMRWAFAGLSTLSALPSVVAVTYLVFAQGLPFVVLLLFAGRDPSILWARTAAHPKTSRRTPNRKPRAIR